MATELDLRLARFLRAMRGDEPRASFCRRLGVSEAHLYRLEAGDSSVTMGKLDGILRGLRCTLEFKGPALPAVAESPAPYRVQRRRRKRRGDSR